MSNTISTIIVNYNAGPLLRGCVDSLLACPLGIEIIVVDNASSDGSLDGLPESPCIRVIRNPTNVGFAAACNVGMQASWSCGSIREYSASADVELISSYIKWKYRRQLELD